MVCLHVAEIDATCQWAGDHVAVIWRELMLGMAGNPPLLRFTDNNNNNNNIDDDDHGTWHDH